MNRLRAAVIGVGYLGNFHAQKYKNNSQVELVGVCDGNNAQVQKISVDLKVAAYTSAKDLIGKVDIVTIAASTQAHYELAHLFLENGVHVNVEKPITAHSHQAEKLIELAAKKNLKLAVGHIERFNPAIVELKKHLKQPKYFELIRHAPFKPRGADVSVLHDLMIHDLDLMFWLSGSDVDTFSGAAEVILTKEYDVAVFNACMKNGVVAQISVNRMASQTQRLIRVAQKNSYIQCHTGSLEMEIGEPMDSQSAEPIKWNRYTVEKKDALQAETDAFVECVVQNKKPVVSGEDGLKALKTIEQFQNSLK